MKTLKETVYVTGYSNFKIDPDYIPVGVYRHLRKGHKIPAIKLFREAYPTHLVPEECHGGNKYLNLKAAKDAVKDIERQLGFNREPMYYLINLLWGTPRVNLTKKEVSDYMIENNLNDYDVYVFSSKDEIKLTKKTVFELE